MPTISQFVNATDNDDAGDNIDATIIMFILTSVSPDVI